ncbi:hypothetical protein [Spirosoma linguale]|uniref:Uncharacterized protein n=1 Tax=Spirosoma linguale (strain ATCC 33905 / DSM 74 / LMG 10896 / Claus 1) TaxID=504472 RepID=D2QLW7_SPILD|nr:hypothetical protein Slin_1273 [Spirosoma linguale DSM 74]
MDAVYEWLLHSTGNEGNFYTILNSHRAGGQGSEKVITVMARQPDFKVVNLLITPKQGNGADAFLTEWSKAHTQQQQLSFAGPVEVIDYLATSKVSGSGLADGSIQVLVGTPSGEAGAITFDRN